MINAVELANVRIFDGRGWKFDLAPLTVFCGTNSAGKSTVLKTILLLRQSLGIREASGARPGRLRFVGSQADFGNFQSFTSHNDLSRDVAIGLTVEGRVSPGFLALVPTFRSKIEHLLTGDSGDELFPYALKCDFTLGVPSTEEQQTLFDEQVAPEPQGARRSSGREAFLKAANYEIRFQGEVVLEWKVRLRSYDRDRREPEYDLTMPRSYFVSIPWADLIRDPSDGVGDEVVLRVNLLGPIPDRIIAHLKPTQSLNGKSEQMGIFPLPPHIEEALSDLRRALVAVHYLGPLRSPAKRFYLTQLEEFPALDSAGEFLPYVIRDRAHRKVLNIPPGSDAAPGEERFADALNGWVHFLRTGQWVSMETLAADELNVKSTKEVLHEFKVRAVGGGESYPLMDSGFGYSQVLPIIVRGLLAKPGNTLIVEQPELHLNPALQVRLASFFAAMIRIGKQVILETHSEHLVNAIRVLAAEDDSAKLAQACKIIFIEAETGPIPTIKDLAVQADGTVPEWPRNFFGEATSLVGRLLRSQKRFRTSPAELDTKG